MCRGRKSSSRRAACCISNVFPCYLRTQPASRRSRHMVNHPSSPCARARFAHPHEQHSQRVQRADLLRVTGVQAVFSPVLPLATAPRHVSPLLTPYTPTGARGARPTGVFHRQKSPWPRWPTVFFSRLRTKCHLVFAKCRRSLRDLSNGTLFVRFRTVTFKMHFARLGLDHPDRSVSRPPGLLAVHTVSTAACAAYHGWSHGL